MNSQPVLSVRGVDFGYGRLTVLKNVNLELARGEYLGVVGPNGAGKSTLLLGLLGALAPQVGTVERQAGIGIGYVPQLGSLDSVFPLTVRDVVAMAYDFVGRSPDYARVDALIAQVGLTDRAHRRYRELSGGQKQRALLARAVVADPQLVVLDEPTNGLDLPSEITIMDIVAKLHAEGRTIILVTHMLNLVASHATKLALVGDSAVVCGDKAQLMTAERLSEIYRWPVRVVEFEGRPHVLTALDRAK